MNISARDRRALIVGISALAVILVLKFAVMPGIDYWLATRDSIRNANATLEAYKIKLKRLEYLNKRLAHTYGQSIEKPLTDLKSTRIHFHKAVQDVIKTSGIQMQSLQPQAVRSIKKHVPGVAVLPVRVVGKCQLPQLAKCLAQVRAAPCLIIVDRVDIASDPKKPNELSVTMVLATFVEEGADQ